MVYLAFLLPGHGWMLSWSLLSPDILNSTTFIHTHISAAVLVSEARDLFEENTDLINCTESQPGWSKLNTTAEMKSSATSFHLLSSHQATNGFRKFSEKKILVLCVKLYRWTEKTYVIRMVIEETETNSVITLPQCHRSVYITRTLVSV